jgi:tetratricopeptide (TPR) repeat protein
MKKGIIFVLLVTGALVPWCTQVVFASLEQSETAFLKGDYNVAVQNCDDLIRSGTDAAQAYCLKGRVLLKQNQTGKAREAFNKVLTDFSKSDVCDQAQLGLGDISFAENNFDAAIGEYRKLQEGYPQSSLSALALYKLGKSCLKADRHQEARFYFQKLQKDYPLSFESKLVDELDDSQFNYSVQVGCFSRYENADKLTAKLKKEGFDAYVSEKDGYPVFYRVRVGNFKTPQEADSCKVRLQKKGYKTKLCP